MKSKKLGNLENSQQNLTKKLQGVQARLDEISKIIADKSFIGTAGGGVVEVILKGDKTLKEISLKKEKIEEILPEGVSLSEEQKETILKVIDNLSDLIIAATNYGLEKIDKYTDDEIAKVTKGIPIPGLN